MVKIAVLLGCATLLASCALRDAYIPAAERHAANEPAAIQGGGEAAETRSRGSRRICTNERTTGSHLPRRVCRTQEQIERERENVEEIMREMGTRPTVGSGEGR